jgi:hypothetical protein
MDRYSEVHKDREGRAEGPRRWAQRGRLVAVAVMVGLTAPVGVTAAAAEAGPAPAPAASASLTEAQVRGLQHMREEEKLARDVYRALGERWQVPIFARIAASEQRHMEAVGTLLDRYGLEDPAAGTEPGQFVSPDLQALYTDLVRDGTRSLTAALRVGGLVEEIDLIDLRRELAATDRADVRAVYENLSRGTRNHLRAFARQTEGQTGSPYEPQKLSRDDYGQIATMGVERGGGHGAGRGGRGRGACAGAGGCGGRGRGAGRACPVEAPGSSSS